MLHRLTLFSLLALALLTPVAACQSVEVFPIDDEEDGGDASAEASAPQNDAGDASTDAPADAIDDG